MSNIKTIITAFCFILLSATAQSQKGILQGKISDGATGESLIGATVKIEPGGLGTVSDIDGNFRIEQINPGIYTVTFSYIGYQEYRLPGIAIQGGETIKINGDLKSGNQELKSAEVVSTKISHTETSVLADMRNSEQIVNGISSQQISKTQDRNTSEIVRRLPGISIIEDRLVIIRGLNERYNSVLINDALAPSAESDKKAFSFDILPSSMVERVMIYKTASPELPGEFAGGVVKIYTKNIPDDNFISFGSSIGIRTNTTFKQFNKASSGKLDWLGIDNGERELPRNFPANISGLSNAQQADLGKQLPNEWTYTSGSAPIDQRYQLGFAKRFAIGKIQSGNITGINYSNTFEARDAENLNYNQFDIANGISDTIYNFKDKTTIQKAAVGVVSNFSFIINTRNKIEFKNLYQQNGANGTTIRTGYNIEEGNDVLNYAYRYNERQVYTGQLCGTHDFNEGNTILSWTGSYSKIHTSEPDYRRIRTYRSLVDDAPGYSIQVNSTASQADAGRFFSKLNEKSASFAGGIEQIFKNEEGGKDIRLKAGYFIETKNRGFSARWLAYTKSRIDRFDNNLLQLPLGQVFLPEHFNDSTGFKIDEGTNGTDSYTADNLLTAFYVSASIPMGEKLKISGGFRYEYNRLQIESADNNGNALTINNPIGRLLPSVNLSWDISKNKLFRFAYGRTLNRPEFRELAPFAYYDFVFNNVLFGNPELKTPSIDNVDFRFENYLSPGEIISFGVFYKNFKLPIEQYFKPGAGSGGTRNFEFRNAESAYSVGAEIELRKSLSELFPSGIFSKMSLGLNAAYIQSRVNLGETTVGQDQNRMMMGQSPYVINSGIYYNNQENKLQFNILYNIIGSRLFAVGTQGTPSVYELPRNLIDLSISKGIGKNIEIKAGIQDILNQSVTLKQDSNEDGVINSTDELVYKFRRGSYYTLGFIVRY